MLLLLHISIALASVLQTSIMLFRPSKTQLRVSYGLLALTLVSGTALVATTQAHILQACMSGLLYVGFVSFGIAVAHRKLADNS